MKCKSSYTVELLHTGKILLATIMYYRNAFSYLIAFFNSQ